MQHLKHIATVLLAFCLLFANLPMSTLAAVSDDFEYTLNDDGTATIARYIGGDASVTVPETIDGYVVTGIGEKAFMNNTALTSVTFPDTLQSIGMKAFESCTALTSVEFPDSLTHIGESAFFNCVLLSEITSTPYLYDIGYHAFHNTTWYMSASNGFLYLGRVLYRYVGVTQPNTIITVPDYTAALACDAFEGQYNITEIHLPVGIRSIGMFAFKNCYALNDVRIPPSVTTIGEFAFLNADAAVVNGVKGSAIELYATDNDVLFKEDNTLNYQDGDIDKDGTVSSTDIRLLMKAVVLSEECDHERFLSCDIVYDGVINTHDIREWMLLSIA